MLLKIALAASLATTASAFGGAGSEQMPIGSWISHQTLSSECSGLTVGTTAPKSCCESGTKEEDVNPGCVADPQVANYYYGVTCNMGKPTIHDDCDSTCTSCKANFKVADDSCMYSAPAGGKEWFYSPKAFFTC